MTFYARVENRFVFFFVFENYVYKNYSVIYSLFINESRSFALSYLEYSSSALLSYIWSTHADPKARIWEVLIVLVLSSLESSNLISLRWCDLRNLANKVTPKGRV